MTVRVVTDSAATLPTDVVDELGIRVVSLRIAIGDRSARDGEFEVADLVANPLEVSTAGPTPRDFLEAIESADDGAVIITVSQQMGGGTFLAAQASSGATSVPVRLVDSETAAGAQGLVVLAAARAAAAGQSLDDVVAAAVHVVDAVRLVATLPDLDQLAKSGHVPGAAAWAARFIGLHPVIEFRRGSARPLRPATTNAAARDRLLQLLAESKPSDSARLHVAALHAMEPDAAGSLLDAVADRHRPVTAFLGPFSTAMIVHTGPGVLGLAWWWEVDP